MSGLASVSPRMLPTPTAMDLGRLAADEGARLRGASTITLKAPDSAVRGKGLKTQPLRLHGWRWFAFGAIVFWLFVTVVVPLFGITLRSFVVTWGEGVNLLDVLTLKVAHCGANGRSFSCPVSTVPSYARWA